MNSIQFKLSSALSELRSLGDENPTSDISFTVASRFNSSNLPRTEKWQETYQRRQELLSCGFHGALNKPYKEIGIISEEPFNIDGYASKKITKIPEAVKSNLQSNKKSKAMGKHLRLRSRANETLPGSNILALQNELINGKKRILLVKSGQSLSKLLQQDKQKAETAKEAQTTAQVEEIKWHSSDMSEDQTESPLSTAPERWKKHSIHITQLLGASLTASQSKHETSAPEDTQDDKLLNSDIVQRNYPSLSKIASNGIIANNDENTLTYRFLATVEYLLECILMKDNSYAPSYYDYIKLPHRLLDYELLNQNFSDKKTSEDKKSRINKLWEYIPFKDPPPFQYSNFNSSNISLSPPSTSTATTSHLTFDRRSSRSPSRIKLTKTKHLKQTNTIKNDDLPKAIPEQREDPHSLVKLDPEEFKEFVEMLETPANKVRTSLMPIQIDYKLPRLLKGPEIDIKEQVSILEDALLQKDLIVHEQLAAMDRARFASCSQKFQALQGNSKVWDEVESMRDAVVTETAETARKKLLMNYHWYDDLLEILPANTVDSKYCKEILDNLNQLSDVACQVGPSVMSRYRLIKVLNLLFTPTELDCSEVEMAIDFIINKMIYLAKDDFEKWKKQHLKSYDAVKQSFKNKLYNM